MSDYIEDQGIAVDRREDRAIIAFMAVDLPEPPEVAAMLAMMEPHLAALILAAYLGPHGWRVRGDSFGSEQVETLRRLGIVEMPGTPTPDKIAKGTGFHLSAFGLKVRRHLREEPKP